MANLHLYPDDPNIKESLEAQGDNNTVFGDKSPGVRRIEAVAQCFTSWHLWVLLISIFLVAYSYGLDGTTRYFFQTYALSSFGDSAQISTVTVVRSIVAAAAQPAFARFSDYFGRLSMIFISVVFYVVGTIVQATSKNLAAFSGGAVLYQLGYTGAQLLVEVIIADSSSLRNRLLLAFIPVSPFIINAWVSGDISAAIYDHSTWQWGIGMWGIIFPVCCIPLFISVISAERRAKRLGLLEGIPSPFKSMGQSRLWVDIFWQIDLIGLLLLAATFALILLPFTLAGGVESIWSTTRVIAPLVVGFVVALPLFTFWELRLARHPIIPFRLLRDRQILAALSIATLLNTAWYTQGDYLYTHLLVSFDRDLVSAARTANIYSFVSTVVGLTLGFVIRYVRHLKWFIVAGTSLFVLAFGLLIRYRGGNGTTEYVGLVAAETILGLAGGMFSYPTLIMAQSAVQHERTAVITSLYLALYSIGSALGNTIAAGIWTNNLSGELLKQFTAAGVADPATLASTTYASYTVILAYPVGTPERDAASLAYQHVQRLLCIAGVSLSALLVISALCLKNPPLGDTQSLPEAEGFDVDARVPYQTDLNQTGSPDQTLHGDQKKRFGLFGKKEQINA